MIYAKDLDLLEERVDEFIAVIETDQEVYSLQLIAEDSKELIRLARLGLWAKARAIPALQRIDLQPDEIGLNADYASEMHQTCWQVAHDALAMLPKDKE